MRTNSQASDQIEGERRSFRSLFCNPLISKSLYEYQLEYQKQVCFECFHFQLLRSSFVYCA